MISKIVKPSLGIKQHPLQGLTLSHVETCHGHCDAMTRPYLESEDLATLLLQALRQNAENCPPLEKMAPPKVKHTPWKLLQ